MEKPRLPDTPFWVEPESVDPHRLKLTPDESHHLLHVHRAKPGTPFEAIDGNGILYECVLESVERRAAVGRIVGRREGAGELPRPIEMIVGLPEWRGVEQVVEHAVPLGVTSLDFASCERSVRGALGPQRVARLIRIARAALKQSRRTRLPSITSSRTVQAALGVLGSGERFMADPAGTPFTAGAIGAPQAPIQLAVGPPGGFSDAERRILLDGGFSPISMGPSRLTTETAALALVSVARNSM